MRRWLGGSFEGARPPPPPSEETGAERGLGRRPEIATFSSRTPTRVEDTTPRALAPYPWRVRVCGPSPLWCRIRAPRRRSCLTCDSGSSSAAGCPRFPDASSDEWNREAGWNRLDREAPRWNASQILLEIDLTPRELFMLAKTIAVPALQLLRRHLREPSLVDVAGGPWGARLKLRSCVEFHGLLVGSVVASLVLDALMESPWATCERAGSSSGSFGVSAAFTASG